MLRKVREHNLVIHGQIKPVVVVHPGATSADIKYHLDKLVEPDERLAACVVHVGFNDLGRSQTGLIVQNIKDMKTMIQEKVPGCEFIYSSIIPNLVDRERNVQALDVNRMVQDFCSAQGNCTFVDHSSSFFVNDELNPVLYSVYDGIHLSDNGAATVAYKLKCTLSDVLPSKRFNTPPRRCFNCGSLSHLQHSCPNYGFCRCGLCGKYGHRIVNCHWSNF